MAGGAGYPRERKDGDTKPVMANVYDVIESKSMFLTEKIGGSLSAYYLELRNALDMRLMSCL